MSGDLKTRLEEIVRATPSLMHVMAVARDLDLPDWLIFSGAIYQPVLNHLTGRDPGLLLTGSAAALVLAFAVRFFALAQGAVDSAFGRISPSLPMAARSLGQGEGGTLVRVYLPLMRGSIGTALLLVFVDSMKELPATLLLRPFNFETLATRVQEKASLENLADAAPAALVIIAVGIVAVALLARSTLGSGDRPPRKPI